MWIDLALISHWTLFNWFELDNKHPPLSPVSEHLFCPKVKKTEHRDFLFFEQLSYLDT